MAEFIVRTKKKQGKATILGPSQAVPVRGGRLRLGTWQSVMLVELDGPRERTVIVEVRGRY